MFDRKEATVKNRKFFISHEYVRKVFDSYNSQRNIKSKDIDSDLKKIQKIQKINISNDQPLVLFHKPDPNNIGLENLIKKDLIENNGYINDGGYKKKLLKYHSHHNTEQNQPKNIFRTSYSHNKNKSKINDSQNNNLFSKKTSFSMALNKRNLQKEYSNSIKKINKRPNLLKHKEEKKKKNRLFNSANIKDLKNKEKLIEKLTNKDTVEKNLFGNVKSNKDNNSIIYGNIFKKNKLDIDYKRKKEYLKKNNISFENDNEKNNDIENDKNNNNKEKEINSMINNKKTNQELKDIKDIKLNNDKRFINVLKSAIYKTNDDNFNNKKEKKRYKNFVNQFEYLEKIRKELKILKKSKDKNKNDLVKKN